MSRKLVSLFLALALVLACVPVLAEGGITVTDMAGREVTLEAPADRVVVMMPADAEILYALGVKDTIVGVGSNCVSPPEIEAMPGIDSLTVVDPMYTFNEESVIGLNPQVVIMTMMAYSEDLVNSLASSGVKVVVTNAQDLEGVYADIALIGKVVGREAEAEALVSQMQQKFADIAAKSMDTGLKLYVDESPLQWGLWSAGKGTYFDDLAEICGLTNIFSDIEGHQSVSEEQVLERNPDIIISMTMYYGEGELPDEEIKNRAGWENVSAVKIGAVVYDPTNAVALPGPRLTEVADLLLELISQFEVTEPAA